MSHFCIEYLNIFVVSSCWAIPHRLPFSHALAWILRFPLALIKVGLWSMFFQGLRSPKTPIIPWQNSVEHPSALCLKQIRHSFLFPLCCLYEQYSNKCVSRGVLSLCLVIIPSWGMATKRSFNDITRLWLEWNVRVQTLMRWRSWKWRNVSLKTYCSRKD